MADLLILLDGILPNGGQSIKNAVADEDTAHHMDSVGAGHKSLQS